jgi:hypothetical protein
MDRPDVTPGTGRLFALQLEYASGYFLYVHYRSSTPNTRNGALLTYCTRSLVNNPSGGYLREFTEDICGDTTSLNDISLPAGKTYIATPSFAARQNTINTLGVPQITVLTIPDWSGCNVNLECPPGTDLSLTVTLSFIDPSTISSRFASPLTSSTTGAASDLLTGASGPLSGVLVLHTDQATLTSTVSLQSGNHALLRVTDGSDLAMRGSGGAGLLTISVCPAVEASIYFYDNFPFSVLDVGAPLGYNSFFSAPIFPFRCCALRTDSAGRPLPLTASAVRAVKIIQNDNLVPLSVAELYAVDAAGNSCLSAAKCYNFNLAADGSSATGGSYYSADSATGWETLVLDRNNLTSSHNGSPYLRGGYVLCIFDQDCVVSKVTVIPRQVCNIAILKPE